MPNEKTKKEKKIREKKNTCQPKEKGGKKEENTRVWHAHLPVSSLPQEGNGNGNVDGYV